MKANESECKNQPKPTKDGCYFGLLVYISTDMKKETKKDKA